MVFLFIFITVIVLVIGLFFSKISIQIANLKFYSRMSRHINEDYKIIFRLYAFGFLPILKINITKTKLEKMKLQEKIKNIDFKYLEQNPSFDKEIFKNIKKLNITIKSINFHVDIGTQNASLTAILVPIISTVVAIILRKKMKRKKHQTFMIHPIYTNQNLVNIFLSGIFELKMSHIINVIYNLSRKEKKGVKKYERTSNRRSYGYSYE